MKIQVSPSIISLGAQGAELHPKLIVGFIEVYQESFRVPPWEEHHLASDVYREVLVPHLPHCALVAILDDRVVGIASAHPVMADMGRESRTRRFLEANRGLVPFPLEETIYMSELAVLPEFWRQGIGLALTQARMNWAKEQGFGSYLMRTATEGSLSKELYEKKIPSSFRIGNLIQNMSGEGVISASAERIYIGGYLQ